jgi:TonB family protein
MSLLPMIGFLLIFGSTSLVDPLFPPLASSGGTVVAELRIADGSIEEINILSGEEPFVSSCKSALAQWRLPSENDGDAIVVVHFRHQNLDNYGTSEELINCIKPKGSLPCPKSIVEPVYPVQIQAQGSVVLKTKISATGSITDIRVLKTLGAMTDSGIDAVQKWKFAPAEDNRGMGRPSSAFVVLVYRFPVIAPVK